MADITNENTTTPAIRAQQATEEVVEVDLKEVAGIELSNEDTTLPEGELISFDQLVMNFLQQHHNTMEEYNKLQEALDNMHYTSTITRISLEYLQEMKDHLNKLGLKFCGFESSKIVPHFKLTNKNKEDPYDLDKWEVYEEANTKAFIGMYQFWCQKVD